MTAGTVGTVLDMAADPPPRCPHGVGAEPCTACAERLELEALRERVSALEARLRVCARCGYPMEPDGRRQVLELEGKSHGICAPCELAYDAEIDAADAGAGE